MREGGVLGDVDTRDGRRFAGIKARWEWVQRRAESDKVETCGWTAFQGVLL